MPKIYKAKEYTESMLEELEVEDIQFPYSDNLMKYNGLTHCYVPEEDAFLKRGIDIRKELKERGINDVLSFMQQVSDKFYAYVSKRCLCDSELKRKYIIAKRGLKNNYGNMYEYRMAVVDAMVTLGDYLAINGDLGQINGVDLGENLTIDINTLRYEERDYPNGFRSKMASLGLNYVGEYKGIDISSVGKEW